MNWKRQVKFLREQQEREQAWSATQAQRQMDFQHQETSTAHQREVADLQAAGLNPVLSAGGSGAQSGSGAMANADSILPELMSILKSMAHSGGGARVVVNNETPAERTPYKTGKGEFGSSGPSAKSTTNRKTGVSDFDKQVKENGKKLARDVKAEVKRFRDVVGNTPVTASVSSNGLMRVMSRSTAGQLVDDIKALGALASNTGKAHGRFFNKTYHDAMSVIQKEVNKLPKSQQKQFWDDFYR